MQHIKERVGKAGWVRTHWVGAVLYGALLCGAVTLSAHADFRESYKAGQDALAGERWAAAERFFSEAIGERAEERYNALLGRRYFPHYYLGVARSEQGNCQGALTAFRETERQGKLQRMPELVQDMERRRQRCSDRQADVKRRADGVVEVLDQAVDDFGTLDSLRQNPTLGSLWDLGNPSFASRLQQLRGQESQLRQQLSAARGRESIDDVQSVADLADNLRREARQLIQAARTELGDRNAATASALESVEAIEGKARRQVRLVRDLAPYPPGLARRVRAVETLLDDVLQNKDTAQSAQLKAWEERLNDALQQLSRASRRPSEGLRGAVDSYLQGNYEAALEGLETLRPRRDAGKAQLCLLRAASRYHLFMLSGEQAIELEAAAMDDLQGCEVDMPAPGTTYFSPRFVQFFDLAMTPPDALEPDGTALPDADSAPSDGEATDPSTL